jgi:hypothetical protein
MVYGLWSMIYDRPPRGTPTRRQSTAFRRSVTIVVCPNKAQASLRISKRFAIDRGRGRRASVWSAAACRRFVGGCCAALRIYSVLAR